MLIIPAIDLIGGQCVRLYKGDYAREKVYDPDPARRARFWQEGGAELIHIVDLEGARGGEQPNLEAIRAIRAAVSCAIEVGGGIRSAEDAERLLEAGINRVIVGTLAMRDPVPVEYLARRYPERIILGADARDGLVSSDGWEKTAGRDVYEFAASFNRLPLGGVLFTDIDTDGTLTGPNIPAQRRMGGVITNPLIASGGIASLDDITALARAGIPNIYGVIIGTALYEGLFTLEQAIAAVRTAEEN